MHKNYQINQSPYFTDEKINNQKNKNNNKKTFYQIKRNVNQNDKKNFEDLEISFRSNTEIILDNFYQESKRLQNTILENSQDHFAQKLSKIMKLDTIGKYDFCTKYFLLNLKIQPKNI